MTINVMTKPNAMVNRIVLFLVTTSSFKRV